MQITVEVVAIGEPPPAGSPVIVQVRDASLEDAEAVTIADARVHSRACEPGEPLARAQVSADTRGGSSIVWVHVDVDRSGDVTRGDYITMQSYPVGDGGAIRVEVRRVG